MIYADVIVGSRTNVQELSYAIPASIIPYISVGSTVIVPLRKQQVTGVVTALRRNVPANVKGRLREVLSIEKNNTGFTQAQISTIEQLAQYYGCSLAEVAYHALAWPRKIHKKNIPKKIIRPTYIQALWPDRLHFYGQLITKYSTKNNLVFLFSAEEYLHIFTEYCEKNNIKLITLNTARAEKILREKLIKNELYIVAGLQKASFVPLDTNDFLIIDEPDAIGYKSQKRPFMTSKRIGLIRAETENIQLIMGSNLLTVGDYLQRQQKKWRVIEKKIPPLTVQIFDRTKTKGLLLPGVIEEIDTTKSALFLVASKAWAPAMLCTNCNQTVSCERCARSLAVISKELLTCLYCGHKQPVPAVCPSCKQLALKPIGEGSLQLFQKLESVFGAAKVALISSLTKDKPDKPIVVATEKIINFPEARFNTVVLANMDRQLMGTNIDGSWQLLHTLLQLRVLSQNIIIQTHLPDHWVWAAFSSGNLSEYYQSELAQRKRYMLPPFGQKIILVATGNLPSLQEASAEITAKIMSQFPKLDVGELTINRAYNNTYQAELPVFSPIIISAKQKHLLRSILPLSWFICSFE